MTTIVLYDNIGLISDLPTDNKILHGSWRLKMVDACTHEIGSRVAFVTQVHARADQYQ